MAGRSGSNAGTIVVAVLLVGVLGVIWSSLATMIESMRPTGPFQEPTGGSGADLVTEARALARTEGGQGTTDMDLVDALQPIAEPVAEVRQLAAEPVPTPPSPTLSESPSVQAARGALERGDCVGASDALFSGGRLDPASGPMLEDVWRCFDRGGGLGGLKERLADAPPAAGKLPPGTADALEASEARLVTFDATSAGGFQDYLQELVGTAALTAQIQSGLDAEALLAEWSSANPRDQADTRYWADRVQALAGGLSGPSGEYLAEHDPDAHLALEERLAAQLDATDLPPEVRAAWVDGLTMGIEDPLPAPTEAPAFDDGAEPTSDLGVAEDEAPPGDLDEECSPDELVADP